MSSGKTNHEKAQEAGVKNAGDIRVASYGGHDGSFSLRGATSQELEHLRGMVENRFWVTVDDDGRLRKVNKFADVPGPVDDESMMPFWAPALPGQVQTQLPLEQLPVGWFIPGLEIQALGAGVNGANAYQNQVDLAESFGFECLRSRRDPDSGRFWEIWSLFFLEAARGQLREVVDTHKEEGVRKQLEESIRFLCRNMSFGSLDVKWQVAALVYD